jgi:MFS family permease
MTRQLPILRNTVLLAASLTSLSGMLQLAVAVATTTLVLVTGIEGILGLGPAILLASSAAAALPAGRAMDRFGRVPVLATGFAIGAVGAATTALACELVQAPLVIVGFTLLGASQGIVLLSRAAAGDMYPPDRRARGISFVLFGAVFGALLGPFVFGPLFAGRHLDTDALVVPWLAAGGFMLVGLGLTLAVRPDPRKIALALATGAGGAGEAAAAEPPSPLSLVLRRPGVAPALVAAVASFAVMVAVMNLTGYVMVGHGHEQSDVFPVISAHIVGMYGLVLVVGDLIDRISRRRALIGGLLVMGGSTLVLAWATSGFATGVALFGLGLGWSFSYIAATTQLVDLAAPAERGRLIGFCDLSSGLCGAALALIGGVTYSELGVGVLAVGAAVAATAPAAGIFLSERRRAVAALEPLS